MRPFIGVDDLSAVLGTTATDLDLITAIALDSGCEAVRSYIGQMVNYVEDDVEEHDGKGTRTIRVEQRPIRDITSVEVDGVALDASVLSVRKSLIRRKDDVFPRGLGNVVVTYSHGWDVIPDNSAGDDLLVPADLRLVALLSARRAYAAVGANDGQEQSETIGQYSYSLSTTAQSAAELMTAEERVLDRYKIRMTP
jgi:hypothetical protein